MDGVDRHAIRLGQRIRVATFEIDGTDRIGLIRWQAVDQRQEALADLVLLRRRRSGLDLQRLHVPYAGPIEDRMADDAVEPGVDALGILELVEVTGRPQECILEDVVDRMRIRHPAPDEGAEAVQISQQTRLGLALRRCRHGVGPSRWAS